MLCAGDGKCTNCITFSASQPFAIKLNQGSGTTGAKIDNKPPSVNLEWSTDQVKWSELKTTLFARKGETLVPYNYPAALDGDTYKIYVRGTNNLGFANIKGGSVKTCSNFFTNSFDTVATEIECSGNVMTLLDWKTVAKGEEPQIEIWSYNQVLRGSNDLVKWYDITEMSQKKDYNFFKIEMRPEPK